MKDGLSLIDSIIKNGQSKQDGILCGDKVRLIRPSVSDCDFIMRIENDPQTWIHTDTVLPYSVDSVVSMIRRGGDFYQANVMMFIIQTVDCQNAGIVSVFNIDHYSRKAEVGIHIIEEFRQKGIASESLCLLSNFCFEHLDIQMLYATILSDNEPSRRLFNNAGFSQSGLLSRWKRIGRNFADAVLVQKLRED